MARRPPSDCRVRALPALPLLLSLLLLLLQPATPGVTCPPPTSVEHADIRVKSYSLKSRERYTCNSGFKRKAGTSSLTQCVFNKTTNIAHWTIPNLKCIRDPSLTHLRPFSTEVPAGVTPEPESTSLSGKGTYSYHSRSMTEVIGSILAVVCAVVVVIVVCYRKLRHTVQTPSVEMESMEEMPMTRGTNGREEDAENYPHDLGHSRERLRAAEAGAKAPTLP
ncbi:interleukin-15 receptor subunit alpha isoform X2 [Lutra lutra]|uniref:interleukin-15 receptor subunit alpha isoform X2 n=1 Tax=Lutra lutra TaxID=9657 RepID=UPI001FD36A3E|nr:interleukin-15 receptor subunit alpha isoform X2 [Lutra lutra]